MGFDHRRMEVRGGGTRRAADDGGPAGREADAEGPERGRTFVKDDVDAQPPIADDRQCERSVPRPG